MMRTRLLPSLLAGQLALAALAVQPVLAQATQPSAADAAALRDQLRAWFSSLVGPAGALKTDRALPELPLVVTPEGTRYRIAVPLGSLIGGAGAEASVLVRPLDKVRWAIESLRLPDSGTASPATDAAEPPGKRRGPNDQNLPPASPTLTWTLGGQSLSGEVDTSLASRSAVDLELRDIAMHGTEAGNRHRQTIGRYAARLALAPAGDGRFDLLQEGGIDDWLISSVDSDGDETAAGVRRTRIDARIDGLSRAGATQLAASVYDLATSRPTDAGRHDLSPDGRAAARSAVLLLAGLMSRIEVRETLDDVVFQAPGLGNATLSGMRVGFGGEASNGRLHAWMDLALSGLSADAMPPQFVRYMPARVAFRPALSGVSVDGVLKLLQDALEDGADQGRLAAQAMLLATDKDVSLGLEALQVEMAPLHIDGTGRVRFLPGGKPGLEARLSATGLDAMMAEASKDPALAQIMPFIIMARGLGRPEADRLVWDIIATADQTLVNGMDVAAMGGQAPAQPRKSKR